jgi:hypothetical protein
MKTTILENWRKKIVIYKRWNHLYIKKFKKLIHETLEDQGLKEEYEMWKRVITF